MEFLGTLSTTIPPVSDDAKPQVPFETRARRASELMYSRHDESPTSCPTTSPRFLFPSFFFASTPVIRQLAKEIRIHNSNRFAALPVAPLSTGLVPPFFRRHVRVSKLLSLRVYKVD